MTRRVRADDSIDDLRRAFRQLDPTTSGRIHSGELRYVLTGSGSRLSDDEVDEVLKEIGVDEGGMIDYERLLQTFVLT